MITSWILLSLIMIALLYTALIIKREKKDYLKRAKLKKFFDYKLLIPPWWSSTEESPQHMRFERQDTHHNWIARFERKPCPPSLTSEEIVQKECERMEIEFGPEPPEKTTDAHFIKNHSLRERLSSQSIRLEGRAHQFQTERCYLDLVIVKQNHCPHYDLFYSRSSVLTGLIEGPYFEQVLKNLTLDLG